MRGGGALELDISEWPWDLSLSCVAFDKLFNFSKPLFPHLYNGTNYAHLKHLV